MSWIVRKADNVFLRGGAIAVSVEDPVTEMLVELPVGYFPNVFRERYDENSPTGTRSLTQVELDAMTATQRDTDIDANKVVQALARATWENLPVGKPTFQQFVDRIKTIYRGL